MVGSVPNKNKLQPEKPKEDSSPLLEIVQLLKSVDTTSKEATFNETHMIGLNGKVIIY